MTRSVMRFVPYKTAQDVTAAPTYEAVCVSGDVEDCGEESGQWLTPHPVEVWMRAHRADTGHGRFRRAFVDYAEVSRAE
ncbi:hypothetical protein ACFVTP_33305 [Streptomyces celluloflavus]|uniref:DUF7848 domain-containing protein n=1 Tax=Streptomyces celluloflavus TaxID=58344 RepID=UPI0036D9D934